MRVSRECLKGLGDFIQQKLDRSSLNLSPQIRKGDWVIGHLSIYAEMRDLTLYY